MENLLGLIRVRVVRGINLAYRDVNSSDPYVVLKMDGQKLKTSVKKNNVNPEWNEDLTLSISDPSQHIKLEVFDKDFFSRDDEMGEAEIEIQPFVEAVNMGAERGGMPNGTVLKTLQPSRQNCLADESNIVWKDGKVIQDVILRLKNVESGEVELQLLWVDIPH